MNVFYFPQLSKDCEECELHKFAHSPGIGTEWFDKSLHSKDSPTLLVIGQNPGYQEDIENRPFIGKSGQLLREVYLEGSHLTNLCSIWLTNGVRCRTENNVKPPFRCYKTCSDWLVKDLAVLLQDRNEQPLLILTLGGPATTAFWKYIMEEKGSVSLSDAFKRNGTKHILPELGTSFTFYATYHPAFVLRDPKRIHTVHQHTQLILDQLLGVVPEATKPLILHQPIRPSMLTPNTLSRILTSRKKEISRPPGARGRPRTIRYTLYEDSGPEDYALSYKPPLNEPKEPSNE